MAINPLLRFIAALAAGLAGLFLALAAQASCAPVAGLPVWNAALRTAEVPPGEVALRFLGHASFLIESPAGVTIVTDYNGLIRPPRTPDIVTMNHAHPMHYTETPDPAIKMVLRGWDPAGGVPQHNVTFEDVHIYNVPTNIRDWSGGTEYAGNSIFVFEIANLCIAHLGHLHHTLTPQHLAALGPIDVLLVPVDGTWTLSWDDMVEVIGQIAPALIIPMHYFGEATLGQFVERAEKHWPVRTSNTSGIILSRRQLPSHPEVLVLPAAIGD